MSVTWTVSWAVRSTMRSRIWALVSGRPLFGAAAELAATAERACWAAGAAAAASLATPGAGAPIVAPPATPGAGAGGWAALLLVASCGGARGKAGGTGEGVETRAV